MACHDLLSSLAAPTLISWPGTPSFEKCIHFPPAEPRGSWKCFALHPITQKRPVKESLLARRRLLTRKIKWYWKRRVESCFWANKRARSWGASPTERNIQPFILCWCCSIKVVYWSIFQQGHFLKNEDRPHPVWNIPCPHSPRVEMTSSLLSQVAIYTISPN